MINQDKANWKNLNWTIGLDRLYNVIWAIVASVTLITSTIETKNIGIFFFYLCVVVVVPWGIKRVCKWIAQGFMSEKSQH